MYIYVLISVLQSAQWINSECISTNTCFVLPRSHQCGSASYIYICIYIYIYNWPPIATISPQSHCRDKEDGRIGLSSWLYGTSIILLCFLFCACWALCVSWPNFCFNYIYIIINKYYLGGWQQPFLELLQNLWINNLQFIILKCFTFGLIVTFVFILPLLYTQIFLISFHG